MSNNATLNGGYTRLDSQAETTGKGPFDLRGMMSRKTMAARGENQAKCYPNPDDINLGTIPGEFLIYQKALRSTSRSGARSVAVFSSFNGFFHGKWPTVDAAKRDHGVAGVCKTLYNMPGAPSTASAHGRDYQTDTGIAWLESGSISASRNTGRETIRAGNLVVLDFPDTQHRVLSGGKSFYMSPNNPNGGMPLGKFVAVTKPFHPEDMVGHFMTISALLQRTKSQTVAPGCVDLDFHEAHFGRVAGRPDNSTLTNSAMEAKRMFDFTWGIFFNLLESLSTDPTTRGALATIMAEPNNKDRHGLLVTLFNTLEIAKIKPGAAGSNRAVQFFQYLLQQDCHVPSKRQAAIAEFRTNNDGVFKSDGHTINHDMTKESPAHQYAYVTQAPLRGLYTTFAESAAHQNAWIVGRALADSEPGMTLDILVGCFTRPLTR